MGVALSVVSRYDGTIVSLFDVFMACQFGTEKKPGAGDYAYVNLGEIFGCSFPSSDPICNFLASLGNKVELVALDDLCNTVFPPPPPLEPADFINPVVAYQKLLAQGRAMQWLESCQCKSDPDPPTVFYPPSGGQCEGVEYDVTVLFQLNHLPPAAPATYRTYGAVLPVRLVYTPATPSAVQRWNYYADRRFADGSIHETSIGATSDPHTFSVLSVSRVDGQPDNCGNPPPGGNPPPPPPPPTPPPPVYPPSLPAPPVPFCPCPSITIIDIENLIKFSPEIQIKLKGDKGDTGAPGAPGADGKDAELTPEQAECIAYTCKTVKYIYKSLEKTDGMIAGKEIQDFFSNGVQSGRYTMNGRIAEVDIDIVYTPENIRTQYGEAADTVHFLGWYYWFNAKGDSVRKPVHFLKNRLLPPIGLDGYSGFGFTLQHGVKANVHIAYFLPQQLPVPI